MQAFLTDYPSRLSAFKAGNLVDVNLVSAGTFEQPVAFTLGLMRLISPDSYQLSHGQVFDVSRIVEQAYRELVDATASYVSRETVIVDFALEERGPLSDLRVMFGFVSDRNKGMAVPAVTIGRRCDFELD